MSITKTREVFSLPNVHYAYNSNRPHQSKIKMKFGQMRAIVVMLMSDVEAYSCSCSFSLKRASLSF